MTETTVSILHINKFFDQWFNKSDLDKSPAREEKNIKVLFGEVSKDNPYKAIAAVQAKEGVIVQHIQENIYNFKKLEQI